MANSDLEMRDIGTVGGFNPLACSDNHASLMVRLFRELWLIDSNWGARRFTQKLETFDT